MDRLGTNRQRALDRPGCELDRTRWHRRLRGLERQHARGTQCGARAPAQWRPDGLLDAASNTGETFDLLVVGAGISGLSSAYTFHHQRPNGRVLLLDQHPVFGGEAKQNEFEVDGVHLWAPQGSTGMVFPLNRAKEHNFFSDFYDELDFPREFEFQQPRNLTTRELLVPGDMWGPMHIQWEAADIGYFFESRDSSRTCGATDCATRPGATRSGSTS
ncbi:MAG: NAD(P)/FAD-dependent oxidoreductase [Rhodocyclaceae bacterium]|nr:NAD(P)/FAD-dependent oxidoreductase [Rhodocyclaceae bacterium]